MIWEEDCLLHYIANHRYLILRLKSTIIEPNYTNKHIFSADVVSLYTNINHLVALECIRKILDYYFDATENSKPDFLLKLFEYVLTMNNFQFDGKDYLEVGGTAMGTRVAPNLANFVMGDFEEKFVYPYKLQSVIWIRFLDDVFGIWRHGEESLSVFKDYLNSVDPNLKFTLEYSLESINFLDTMVHLDQESG